MWLALLVACTGPATAIDTDSDPPRVDTSDTDPLPPGRVWVEVSTAPCARDAEGWVECWYTPDWGPLVGDQDPLSLRIPDSPAPMSMFYAPNSETVWGIAAETGSSINWFCGASVDTPPGPSDTPGQCQEHPLTDPIALGYRCGVGNGRLVCAEDIGDAAEDSIRLADVDLYVFYLTTEGRLRSWSASPGPGVDIALPRADEVVQLAQAGNGGCVRYQAGDVECFGSENGDPVFDNPPYRDLQGGLWSVCATREDWTIECNDGAVLNFGPYRDMDVSTNRNRVIQPSWLEGRSVCVITEDNAVRCDGLRYDGYPDLLAKLPQGN